MNQVRQMCYCLLRSVVLDIKHLIYFTADDGESLLTLIRACQPHIYTQIEYKKGLFCHLKKKA